MSVSSVWTIRGLGFRQGTRQGVSPSVSCCCCSCALTFIPAAASVCVCERERACACAWLLIEPGLQRNDQFVLRHIRGWPFIRAALDVDETGGQTVQMLKIGMLSLINVWLQLSAHCIYPVQPVGMTTIETLPLDHWLSLLQTKVARWIPLKWNTRNRQHCLTVS